MTDQLVNLMRQFNFSQIAAQIYSLLLTNGPLSIEQLENAARLPRENIDRSLKRLLNLRLVSTDHQRGHPVYYATDPSLAWLAITADLVWATSTTLKPIRNLPETDNPSIEGLRLLCDKISTLAQDLYRPQVAVLQHKERDAEGPEELAQLTCEIIYQARRQVLAVSRSPRLPQVSSFWTVLTSRIENGVQYRRIVDLEEFIDHGLKIVARDMEDYDIDLRLLEHDQLQYSFYVVDNRYLAVLNKPLKSLGNAKHGVGRITNQRQIITRYRKRFDQYYATSIPGRFVVTHMREAGDRLLKDASLKLSPAEVLWLEDLIDFGKFSKFHLEKKWSRERLSIAEQRATKAGFVCRNADSDIIPVYPTNESELRLAYTST